MPMHGLNTRLKNIQPILDEHEWKPHPLYRNYYIAKKEVLIYNKNSENILYGGRDILGYAKFSLAYEGKKFFKFLSSNTKTRFSILSLFFIFYRVKKAKISLIRLV